MQAASGLFAAPAIRVFAVKASGTVPMARSRAVIQVLMPPTRRAQIKGAQIAPNLQQRCRWLTIFVVTAGRQGQRWLLRKLQANMMIGSAICPTNLMTGVAMRGRIAE